MSVKGSALLTEWQELAARHARVFDALEKELQRKHQLGVTEFEALRRLADESAHGCRLQQLVDEVHMSQSALSRLISRLEADGLVERRSCSDDRRGIYACITPAGIERLNEALPTQQDVLERTL